MKLHIIHLTDIHIKSKYDKILSKAAELSKACNDIIHEPTDVIIAVTGDMAAYNGPLVKTSNEDLKVNIRSKACPVIIVAGNQRRHEKLIRESPLTMGLGRLG